MSIERFAAVNAKETEEIKHEAERIQENPTRP